MLLADLAAHEHEPIALGDGLTANGTGLSHASRFTRPSGTRVWSPDLALRPLESPLPCWRTPRALAFAPQAFAWPLPSRATSPREPRARPRSSQDRLRCRRWGTRSGHSAMNGSGSTYFSGPSFDGRMEIAEMKMRRGLLHAAVAEETDDVAPFTGVPRSSPRGIAARWKYWVNTVPFRWERRTNRPP